MNEPRIFEHFPTGRKVCPVYKTTDDKPCVLVEIDRTAFGGTAEAEIVHVNCAIATNYNSEIKCLYRRIQ